jgi:hypothetical protein
MSVQFIKIKQGRKRFLKTQEIADFTNWMYFLAQLKNFLAVQSALQIVGEKIYFEMSSESNRFKIMLEVIGLPISPKENELILADFEKGDILVHKLLGYDLFTLDFDHLLKISLGLKRTLLSSLSKQQEVLADIFHIVFDQGKIELHFFRQKDYIQKQF